MAGFRSSIVQADMIQLRLHDDTTLTITRDDVLAYRATHNLQETRDHFRDMIGTFLGIEPADISNRTLMEIAANGDLTGLEIVWGDLP